MADSWNITHILIVLRVGDPSYSFLIEWPIQRISSRVSDNP